MISSKYNSINYVKYLNNCDLNYKYFLKSLNETPVLDKIIFELPTNMLPNMEIMDDDYKNRMLLKCFLAFYFINFKMSYINCNNFKNANIVTGTNNSFHYSYLTSYNNSTEKYKLLSVLFNENDRDNTSINVLTKLNKNISIDNCKTDILNFRLEIQPLKVVEYKDIFNLFFTRAELQKVKLKLNLVFKKFNNKKITINEFKNFFFLWNI
jgi:hypothetical protein